ncbi:hypothetical protein KXV22_005839 [Aspergillus fumigatus]|nr:hypothetical protein CNMCM8714_000788 [Aspergillus fumigatus]KAF4274021.1 hypothetical protein CNMCM8812_006425 [Aspergillus fumigatus]KAF4276592.1 hypothetical protein CNMCM8057_004206 [Aspergillus fumigatus]KAF4286763.1 hypothetical protein CNMCM8689_001892 [Aspergillus fumigatus]KAF4293626.1 hypothetical protein CNMCM8686_005614 [Aspergillus fumigatus]
MTRYSPDSEAPAVIVLTLFLMVTSVLGSLARLGTKWWKFGSLFLDDYYILLALLMSIAQSVAIAMAVKNGYGSHLTSLDDSRVDSIMKSQYVATFFYILAIAFSQLAFLCFVQQLTPTSRNKVVFLALQIIIAVWEAFFIYLGVSNILTDVAIIAQAVQVIAIVQTTWKRRANIIAVFLFRVIVPGALMAQVYFIHSTINSSDATSETWPVTVASQLVQCLSIVTASAPQFIPFLKQLQSTGMRLDGMTRYTLSSHHKSSRGRYYLSTDRRRTGNESTHELDNIPLATTKTVVTSNANGLEEDHDNESQSSQTGIIRETRTWTVTEEHTCLPGHNG